MLSPSRITLEYKGKIPPQPDRENAFAGASGGGDGSEIQRSPSLSGRLRFRPYPEIPLLDNGLTEVLLEAIHLMHPLVKDRDDADVAIGKPPPVHEMPLVAEEIPLHSELGRYGSRNDSACVDLLEGGEQTGDVGFGLCLAPPVAGVSVDLVEAQ